jgi:hypothetical protein
VILVVVGKKKVRRVCLNIEGDCFLTGPCTVKTGRGNEVDWAGDPLEKSDHA